MRKGWLIAAVLGGVTTTGVARAADVQIFGIDTPSQGKWAVYARISNAQSAVDASQAVAGLSSISIDVLTNNQAGTGSATVSGGATNTLPFGHTIYQDVDGFFPDPNHPDPDFVPYGFGLLRSAGTSDALGIHKITAAQYAIIGPGSSPPYKNFVLSGVGLTPGSKAVGGDFAEATAWDYPVQIAKGTYTPSAVTGVGSTVGLKIAFSPGTGVDLVRGSAATGWNVEGAIGATVIDARNFTQNATLVGDATVKAGNGDANLDGTVDFNDLVKLAQNYNTSGGKTWFNGDFNYDGNVDFNDLVLLAQNYNTPVASDPVFGAAFNADMAKAFASVPEPGLLSLAGAAVVGLSIRLRGRKSS